MKVQIPGYGNRKIKLCCRSVWIVINTFRETQKSCLIEGYGTIPEIIQVPQLV